jgi:hypothetical protein
LNLHYCIPLSFLTLCLITAIALLSSLLTSNTNIAQCPIYDCSWINATTNSNIGNTTTTTYNLNMTNEISFSVYYNISLSSITTLSTSTSTTTRGRNLLYGADCTEHEECALSKNLFCQYEFDLNEKHCFCETTYFWNKNLQQCG